MFADSITPGSCGASVWDAPRDIVDDIRERLRSPAVSDAEQTHLVEMARSILRQRQLARMSRKAVWK